MVFFCVARSLTSPSLLLCCNATRLSAFCLFVGPQTASGRAAGRWRVVCGSEGGGRRAGLAGGVLRAAAEADVRDSGSWGDLTRPLGVQQAGNTETASGTLDGWEPPPSSCGGLLLVHQTDVCSVTCAAAHSTPPGAVAQAWQNEVSAVLWAARCPARVGPFASRAALRAAANRTKAHCGSVVTVLARARGARTTRILPNCPRPPVQPCG